MHQVLQRTRPAAAPSPPQKSRLRSLLRSFLPGRRALVLLAIVGGATLSSQALLGLLRQGGQQTPAPGGSEGREEASSSPDPAGRPPATPAPTLPSAAGDRAQADAAAPDAAGSAAAGRERWHSEAASATAESGTTPRPGRDATAEASGVASPSQQPSPGWWRPWRSRQAAPASQGVITDTAADLSPRPAALPAAVPAAPVVAPAPQRAAAGSERVRQLGTVSLSDLDPFLGVPCSDTTAALPSDSPSEEAWLPGSDATSAVQSAALDPIPVPPIYSESPELAAGPSRQSLHAYRNTPCLPKQPAGRN